jgi:fluoride exporter
MKIALSIALGGSIGALSRYYISKFITNMSGIIFPSGTLVINLTGSLLIGFFYAIFDKTVIPAEIRTFVNVGFIGAFTTFSTFALENVNLFRDGETKLALVNIIVSNVFGLVCVLLGMYIAELLFRK